MKKLLISAVVALFLQGCTSKVEIPIKHAGVVTSDEQVSSEVLRPGEHLVNFGSEVIIYDVSPVSLDIEFDFLFSDTSEGKLKVDIEFNPITDSLSAFYEKYQSKDVTPIVDQGTRKVVRSSLFKQKPTDLTKDEIEIEIIKAIKTNNAIINYVDIKKVDIVELMY